MASSTIKKMYTSELATPNSTYIGNNYLFVTKVGRLVNVSGRFQVTTEKPSGAENYLFSGLPIPKGVIIGFTESGTEFYISQKGHLTSHDVVGTGYWDLQFTYCEN